MKSYNPKKVEAQRKLIGKPDHVGVYYCNPSESENVEFVGNLVVADGRCLEDCCQKKVDSLGPFHFTGDPKF